MTSTVAFASAIDAYVYGQYRRPARDRPVFTSRVTADGSSGVRAESDRFHIYARWSCPASHRLTILRGLAGLADVVSVSYVDGLRDGRGWAFRERTGPDPVNGFTLLREAYEASRPGYAGDISVPVLGR